MPTEDRAKVNRVSFSLEPEYQELLTKISRKMRSTKTAELRRMIDERAVTIGLKPIAPVSTGVQAAVDDVTEPGQRTRRREPTGRGHAARPTSDARQTALASQAVLARDWDTPEEDEAWADL